ncbi:hypothetical protein [Psychroserpens ponticola]|uniref:Uncharacterized protein n=1 Tax=Psychroserpens ponticola TaxID=2932268 RepID=A0ABY7RT05_9FLAO|nr:hypothetical protein [Psychroserpens ponticola]WCO00239.1 hypothetical protein MUN68_009140 [Psychroserpens ponticola]
MKEPIILDNELDFEYNMYEPSIFLKYKGKLFTGTVILENGKSYIEYTNGNQDGRSVDYYDNGQIAEDYLMKNGSLINGKNWYSDGQIKYNSKTDTKWDKDGVVTRNNHSWYYKNGKVRYSNNSNGKRMYYSSKGKLAFKVISSNDKPYNINSITYYHNVLIESYKDFLEHIYLDAQYNCSFRDIAYHYVIGWIRKLYHLGFKKESITLIETIVSDSKEILNKKPDFKNKSTEKNKIHNLPILIKILKQEELDKRNDPENENTLSRIIF